jgi:G3E family GTPase
VRFDSVTTVIDAADGITTLDRHRVAMDQVKAADILLINKIDLVDDETLAGLKRRLASLNQRAVLLTATQGDIPPGLLYGTDPMEEVIPGAGCARTPSAGRRPTHDQDGIQSIKLEFGEPLEHEGFLDILHQIPPNILRVKGVLDFSGHPTPMVLQYVGGRYDLSAFANSRSKERFLVFIGTDLDPVGLQTLTGGKVDRHAFQANAISQCGRPAIRQWSGRLGPLLPMGLGKPSLTPRATDSSANKFQSEKSKENSLLKK